MRRVSDALRNTLNPIALSPPQLREILDGGADPCILDFGPIVALSGGNDRMQTDWRGFRVPGKESMTKSSLAQITSGRFFWLLAAIVASIMIAGFAPSGSIGRWEAG